MLKQLEIPRKELIKALAVAGLFGNVIKHNATISGADGGCQAEVGSAGAMAAAAYGWVLELNNSLIEYAAEMGLEHNLGLTCDPVGGYVQIPCIERNGFGALRAIDAASYAKQLGYLRKNKVSFDSIVNVMKETGKDLNSAYKETSLGGLAKEFGLKDGDAIVYTYIFLFANLFVAIVIFVRFIMIKNKVIYIYKDCKKNCLKLKIII